MRKPSVKFWLLTPTLNQVLRLAILKTLEEEEEEEEDQQQQQQQQASAEIETQAATSGRLPTWGPPQGRNTNIHPFVSPAKGVKKSEAPHINKDSSPLSVLMLLFTEIFHLLVEKTNQQHFDRQAGPSR